MLNQDHILSILTENADTFRRFSMIRIGLFGSYAKGSAHADSDIDLVFEMEKDQTLSFKKRVQIENFLHSLFPHVSIDLVNLKYMNPLVRLEMEKNVIYVSTNANSVRTHYA